jgi:hypothetical protein
LTLRPIDVRLSRQNPEPEGLIRKILGDKGLAARFGALRRVRWLAELRHFWRTEPL